jgi:hypothetical protein
MSDTAMQLRNIARVLQKGFAGQLAFDSAECQGMAKSLATAASELERAERILAALREPSESVSNVVWMEWHRDTTPDGLVRAAVTAAEQEVGRE